MAESLKAAADAARESARKTREQAAVLCRFSVLERKRQSILRRRHPCVLDY